MKTKSLFLTFMLTMVLHGCAIWDGTLDAAKIYGFNKEKFKITRIQSSGIDFYDIGESFYKENKIPINDFDSPPILGQKKLHNGDAYWILIGKKKGVYFAIEYSYVDKKLTHGNSTELSIPKSP